jgi:predicted TIM-barrel fold metal-dependent hydrolase
MERYLRFEFLPCAVALDSKKPFSTVAMTTRIDAHVHLYPAEANADPAAWAAKVGEPDWATLATRVRRDGNPVQGFPSVDELLREMDRAGLDRVVLQGWYWTKPATCALQNRFFADCIRAHPDRLLAFATLHPSAGFWPTLQGMHQARDAGFAGFGELSPHGQGFALDDSVFGEVLTLAADWKMPVTLHVTDPDSKPFPGRIDTPLADFAALARAFPATSFILAHWGGLLPLRDAAAVALPNVWYDTAASPLLYGPEIWARFAAAVPSSRIVFGSDYPLDLYRGKVAGSGVGELMREGAAAGAGDDIMGGNLARLLRL